MSTIDYRPTNMSHYFYWDQVLSIKPEIVEECQATLLKLKQGGCSGLYIKRLRNSNIYSIRVNDKQRLLAAITEIDKKHYLVLLEMSYLHYQDSRFLKDKNKYKRFALDVETNGIASLFDPMLEDSWEDVDEQALSNVLDNLDLGSTRPKPLHFYKNVPLILNDGQTRLQRITAPALVTGLPGSGKTSSLVLLLSSAIQQHKKILVITTSPNVCHDMRQAWEETPIDEKLRNRVRILTWLEWANEVDPSTRGKTVADEAEFTLWYMKNAANLAKMKQYKIPVSRDRNIQKEAHAWQEQMRAAENQETRLKASLKTARNRDKIAELQKSLQAVRQDIRNCLLQIAQVFGDARRYRQEIRIAAGRSKEGYYSLGERQSEFFNNPKEKEFTYALYEAWQAWLKATNQLDPPLTHINVPEDQQANLTLIDEAQDFSQLQFHDLMASSQNQSILAFAAPCQNIHDNISVISTIRDMLRIKRHSPQDIELSGSYRVPFDVMPLAGYIIRTMHKAVGGLAYRGEIKSCEDELEHTSKSGAVYWRDTLSDADLVAIRDAANHAGFAILTHQHFKEEIRAQVGDAVTVMTCQEAKGMQFEGVLLWRVLDTPEFQKISRLLPQFDSLRENTNRPKGQAKWEYARPFNELFTLVSRTSNILAFYQPLSLDNHLSDGLRTSASLKEGELKLVESTAGISAEAWHQLVSDLIGNGNIILARTLFVSKLQGSSEAFDALVTRALRTDAIDYTRATSSSQAASSSPVVPEPLQIVPIPEHLQVPATSTRKFAKTRRKQNGSARAASSESHVLSGSPKATFFGSSAKEPARQTDEAASLFETAGLLEKLQQPNACEYVRDLLHPSKTLARVITMEELGGQLNTSEHAMDTSLFAWLLYECKPEKLKILADLLEVNRGICDDIARFTNTFKAGIASSYVPRFLDLSTLNVLRGSSNPSARKILAILFHPKLLNKHLQLLHLHIPPVCREIVINMHMLPQENWPDILAKASAPAQERIKRILTVIQDTTLIALTNWDELDKNHLYNGEILKLIQDFLQRKLQIPIDKSDKTATINYNLMIGIMSRRGYKITTPFLMTADQLIKYSASNKNREWIQQICTELTSDSQDSNTLFFDFFAKIIYSPDLDIFHPVTALYTLFYATMFQYLETRKIPCQILSEEGRKAHENASVFFAATQRGKTATEQEIEQRNPLFLGTTPDAPAPLHGMLQMASQSPAGEESLLKHLFTISKGITIVQLCSQLGGIECSSQTSLLAWLCKPLAPLRHSLLLGIMAKNPELTRAMHLFLNATVMEGTLNKIADDFSSLRFLNTTVEGKKLLDHFCANMTSLKNEHKRTEIFIQKLSDHYPVKCLNHAMFLHSQNESFWPDTMEGIPQHTEIKEKLKRQNQKGRELWNLSGHDVPFGRKISNALFVIMEGRNIGDAYVDASFFFGITLVIQILNNTKLDVFGLKAGFLRVVRDQYEKTMFFLVQFHTSPPSQWDGILKMLSAHNYPGVDREILLENMILMRTHDHHVRQFLKIEPDSLMSRQHLILTINEAFDAFVTHTYDSSAASSNDIPSPSGKSTAQSVWKTLITSINASEHVSQSAFIAHTLDVLTGITNTDITSPLGAMVRLLVNWLRNPNELRLQEEHNESVSFRP